MRILPSTRAFVRESIESKHQTFFDVLHGYVYGRWVYFYIAVGTREHPLARIVAPLYKIVARLFESRKGGGNHQNINGRKRLTFADTYHGKVVPLDEARKLVLVNQEIAIHDLEHVIPYATAREIVLKNPDHIAVMQCPCRSSRDNPCLPLDVCLIVGEPFASYALDHHPDRARLITPAEAVEILREEYRRGHVHHAFFKDAMIGRFYAICNCCRCCCGAIRAHRDGTPMLASSGYLAEVDHQLCVSCGTCAKYCQFDAITYLDGVKNVDAFACMGCAVCVPKCTKGAISMRRESSKPPPLEIEELMRKAQVSA